MMVSLTESPLPFLSVGIFLFSIEREGRRLSSRVHRPRTLNDWPRRIAGRCGSVGWKERVLDGWLQ